MRAAEEDPVAGHRVERGGDVPRVAEGADVRRLERVETDEHEVVVAVRERPRRLGAGGSGPGRHPRYATPPPTAASTSTGSSFRMGVRGK